MPGFLSWLTNKIRFRRFSLTSGAKVLYSYAIYYGSYSNWRHTPMPTIFVLHSGSKYTHGIAIQYMSRPDKIWFARTLYLLKKGNQYLDGYAMYRFLKTRRYSIVRDCYRLYFTSLLDVKMVSAGLTDRINDVYPSNDSWINMLNRQLEPGEISEGVQVAFSPTEIQERVIQAQNTQPVQTQRVGSFGRAQWARRAPWMRGN